MSREIHLSYRGVGCIIFVFRGEKKKPDLRSGPVSHSETKLQQSSPVMDNRKSFYYPWSSPLHM